MRILAICLCAGFLFCSGCGAVDATVGAAGSLFEKKQKVKSQLEIRQMQTREFDTPDTKMALKAMLNVLQDDGFIIKQVNPEMGFFNGQKMLDAEDRLGKFWGTFWWGPSAQWVENSVIDCTANVSKFADKTRVRANFVIKQMNNKGGVENVRTIDEATFYQDFFSKVGKGMFIEQEKL